MQDTAYAQPVVSESNTRWQSVTHEAQHCQETTAVNRNNRDELSVEGAALGGDIFRFHVVKIHLFLSSDAGNAHSLTHAGLSPSPPPPPPRQAALSAESYSQCQTFSLGIHTVNATGRRWERAPVTCDPWKNELKWTDVWPSRITILHGMAKLS